MERSLFPAWLHGVAFATGTVLLGSLLLTMLLLWTELLESALYPWIYAVNALGVFVGGLVAGWRSKARGWLQGLYTGAGYVALMYLIGFLSFDLSLTPFTLLMLIAAVLLATLGGMIGVSLSS